MLTTGLDGDFSFGVRRLIPVWKLRREITRLSQQLRILPEAFYEPFIQHNHKRKLEKGFPVITGQIAPQGKFALLVIYQKQSVRSSILEFCRHVTGQGYAPFVVSNAPLSNDTIDGLRAVVWKLMIRPNVGYDFGGYRDGLLTLKKQDVALQRVLMMNDSVWYPLRPSDTLSQRLEATDADVAGTVLRGGKKHQFLESYCYLLKERCLESAAFWEFWSTYRLTANKYKVIRRGERGHSTALIGSGLRVDGLFTESEFLERLTLFSDRELEQTLRYAAFPQTELRLASERLLEAPRDFNWRDNVLQHVRHCLEKNQFYSSFPYASARIFDYPVLKTSSDMVARQWRRAYLRAINEGALERVFEDAYTEIRNSVRRDFGTEPRELSDSSSHQTTRRTKSDAS